MKKRTVCLAVLLVLTVALGLGRADFLSDEPSAGPKGYWKRIGVSKEFFHSYSGAAEEDKTSHTQRVLMDGSARIRYTKETPGGTAEAESVFTWDVPGSVYHSREPVELTLRAELRKYDNKADPDFPYWFQYANVNFVSDSNTTRLKSKEHVNKWGVPIDYISISLEKNGNDINSYKDMTLSGRFPHGTAGALMTLRVHIGGVGAVNYLYEFIDEPEFDVSQAKGWWELANVEIKELPEYSYLKYSVSRGMATKYVHFDPDWANHNYALQHMSFHWTEPKQRYLPGQYVDITISLSLDQYVDNGRMPRAGDWMAVGGLNFKDEKGRWFAEVGGQDGIIKKSSDTIHVSAIFPNGEPGYKRVIDVHSQSFGHVLYHYQWQEYKDKVP